MRPPGLPPPQLAAPHAIWTGHSTASGAPPPWLGFNLGAGAVPPPAPPPASLSASPPPLPPEEDDMPLASPSPPQLPPPPLGVDAPGPLPATLPKAVILPARRAQLQAAGAQGTEALRPEQSSQEDVQSATEPAVGAPAGSAAGAASCGSKPKAPVSFHVSPLKKCALFLPPMLCLDCIIFFISLDCNLIVVWRGVRNIKNKYDD